MSFTPWDDPFADLNEPSLSTRPPSLPSPGEPIDLATAAALLDWHRLKILAALNQRSHDLRRRDRDTAITVRGWTADEVVRYWSPALDGVLVGFVTLDDRPSGQSFRSVLVVIDKASGELRVHDETGLLSARAQAPLGAEDGA